MGLSLSFSLLRAVELILSPISLCLSIPYPSVPSSGAKNGKSTKQLINQQRLNEHQVFIIFENVLLFTNLKVS